MIVAGFDFETANQYNGSVCAAGVAIVKDGELIDGKEWRIRPHDTLDFINPMCYAVHGISHESLRDKPEFPEVWPEMLFYLNKGEFVAIHNAAFDLRHLRAVLTLYGLDSVSFPYVCSLCASRRQLPDLPCHKLNYLADYYDIEFVHHNALEDAAACAKILCYTGFPEKLRKSFAFNSQN